MTGAITSQPPPRQPGHPSATGTAIPQNTNSPIPCGLIYWGQVPVHVTIGDTTFTTALFPKDGRYLVPVKVAVQRAEAIGEGAIVEVSPRKATKRIGVDSA